VLFAWLVVTPLVAQNTSGKPSQPAAALPFPEPDVKTPSFSLAELENKALELDGKIGGYPPRIKDGDDRRDTYNKWAYVVLDARALLAKNGDSERMSALLVKLYRQGHNLDVLGSGGKAVTTLQHALKQYPKSVPMHREAGWLYLQTNPAFAPQAEAVLLKLRELLGRNDDIEVERGLVFAYLYQKRNDDALKQIDHCLSFAPDHAQLLSLRKALGGGGKAIVHHEDSPKAIARAPDADEHWDGWMKSFYRTRDTAQFSAYWDMLVKQKLLESPETVAPAIGFVSQVIRQTPGLAKGQLDDLEKIPAAERQSVALILWYADTKESRRILKNHQLAEMLAKRPSKISAYPVNTPGDLDFCWGYFFATGDAAALNPIIGALDLGQFLGAMEKYRNGQRSDADKEAALKEAMFGAAMWSLQANGKEDQKVLAHLEKNFHSTQTPDSRKTYLATILSKILPEKYKLRTANTGE
jgi:tetratricopeptide (TPR) repeat protein